MRGLGGGYNVLLVVVTEVKGKLLFHTVSPASTHLSSQRPFPLGAQ